MKTTIATLNAKYIHTSLALRLLYVANKDNHDIFFREYTIKEKVEKIADELLATNSQIIGLGIYIWNVKQSEDLIRLLKKKNPQLIIILGGPEVTYEPEYFLENWDIDYVISGEGEFVLGELLDAIQKGGLPDISGISSKGNISRHIVQADLKRLSELESPYQLEEDKEEMKNRLIYFETSRGCPYQCQYCLSSLEKGVRYFPQEWLLSNLKYLIDNGAKLIKFLDRTFNLNKAHTFTIFNFLIQNYRPNLSCQFEIYADLLNDETINYLNSSVPKDFFRFEIGIQSTYEPTNIAVKRKQDFPLLANNIRKIMNGGVIDLHLDLIAGLPFENYDRFVKSFNDVFKLGGKEVQLGFLKMLRGTNLRKFADAYGYEYDKDAPYEIKYNNVLSVNDIRHIHRAEDALEKYWNSGKFSQSMNLLFNQYYNNRYFELFDEIGEFYEQNNLPHFGHQLEDLFRNLHQFLTSRNIDIFSVLQSDYYRNFKIRPHGFWEPQIDKQTKKRYYYKIGQDKEFLATHNLSRYNIEKQTAIDYFSDSELALTVFLPIQDSIKYLYLKYPLSKLNQQSE